VRKVIVLHGMGGVGKTQIALQYAHLHRDCYTAVFWIDARNKGTMATSGLHILEKLISHYSIKYPTLHGAERNDRISLDLGIPGQIEASGKLVQGVSGWKIVQDWLAKIGNTKWLLLVDNNDDQEAVRLDDSLPTCEWGNIIITSRNRQACDHGRSVPVYAIGKEAGVQLLLQGVSKNSEELSEEGVIEFTLNTYHQRTNLRFLRKAKCRENHRETWRASPGDCTSRSVHGLHRDRLRTVFSRIGFEHQRYVKYAIQRSLQKRQ
jgi:hypothetical protein